ncbi:MAG TPA: hypothetical protein PLL32_09665 [Anaeromyxobacteraceae bacterium]|nr:hypothetical protein [Anaeromyxobacteraceae bacterium]
MRRMAWAVLAVAALVLAGPIRAEDSPGDAETTESARKATDAVVSEDVRSGAGSMEPAEGDAQEAAERAFVENIWTSP